MGNNLYEEIQNFSPAYSIYVILFAYLLSIKMSENIIFTIPADFERFLATVDNNYRQQLLTIDLFNDVKTAALNPMQKKKFAAVFYHIRGHFIDFMWYIANFTPDADVKEIILQNIQEEMGIGSLVSHEKLYERFAKACGVDIHHELVHQTYFLPFAKEFNKEHLRWLSEHDADEQFVALASYERLDNIDYVYLDQFANSLNLPQQAKTFFKVHIHVQHFNSTLEKLLPIWKATPKKVVDAFDFIYSHQYRMWQQLSDIVFTAE